MMKDRHPESRSSQLSPCPLAAECVLMLDSIDALDPLFAARHGDDDEVSEEDRQRATYLLAHMGSCETCSTAVKNARAMRDRQRNAFAEILHKGELQVPSTVDGIMQALRREHSASNHNHVQPDSVASALIPLPLTRDPAVFATGDTGELPVAKPGIVSRTRPVAIAVSASRRNMRLKKGVGYTFALVAAAALIVVATQLLGSHRGVSTGATTSTAASSSAGSASKDSQSVVNAPSTSFKTAAAWTSLLLVQRATDGRSQQVENYDPTTGHSVLLQSISADAQVDGISHKGDNLIYHEFDSASQRTTYHLLHGGAIPFNGKGTNALWSTDDAYIFVVTDANTIWRVNVSTMQPISLPSHIQADSLVMVRNGFLYYISAHSLYRINIASGQVAKPQLVVATSTSTVFWIDPWTQDVYYYDGATASTHSIYAVPSDPGSTSVSDSKRLIAKHATLIGYADDSGHSPVIMRYNQFSGHFELSSVDKQTGAPQKTLSDNVVDGAQALCQGSSLPTGTICDSSIALSPFATTLVVGASMPGQGYRVTVFNVSPFQAGRILLSSSQPVTLVGWDKLIVP